jgi:methylated-DNA-protein-cysteine methyltransferase-like protein
VATYGQVAAWAGHARAARACGQVLRSYVGGDLPWHRVINAQGRISGGGDLHRPTLQRALLEAEGVSFRRSGRCDLRTHLWEGPAHPMPWE